MSGVNGEVNKTDLEELGLGVMFFCLYLFTQTDSGWRGIGTEWDTVVRYSVDLDTILRIYDL